MGLQSFEKFFGQSSEPVAVEVESHVDKSPAAAKSEPAEWGDHIHFTLDESGVPHLQDGSSFDFQTLRDSAIFALENGNFESKADKGAFRQKVCMAFGLPTNFADEIDEILPEIDTEKLDSKVVTIETVAAEDRPNINLDSEDEVDNDLPAVDD